MKGKYFFEMMMKPGQDESPTPVLTLLAVYGFNPSHRFSIADFAQVSLGC
jgi:hypothetical protein